MMELWLLRHAKAETDATTGRDRDRALSQEGEDRCQYLNAWLKKHLSQYPGPRTIMHSPAKRTTQTAHLWVQGLNTPAPEAVEALWAASVKELITLITDWADAPDPLVLVGHNPGLSDLLAWLARPLPWPGLVPGTLVRLSVDLPLHPGAGEIIEVI